MPPRYDHSTLFDALVTGSGPNTQDMGIYQMYSQLSRSPRSTGCSWCWDELVTNQQIMGPTRPAVVFLAATVNSGQKSRSYRWAMCDVKHLENTHCYS